MNKKKLWPIVGVCLALVVGGFSAALALGGWSEETSVHVNPNVIENSTLAIGTHLIHLSALTDAIYEIAENTGFKDLYYFSNMFKKIVGMSPKKYRETENGVFDNAERSFELYSGDGCGS